jgi:hypothetical protein
MESQNSRLTTCSRTADVESRPCPPGEITRESGLSHSVLLLFSVAAGLSVANVYWAQPLLDAIAASFGVDQAAVGIVITVTQIGYALGLLLLVPLGDLLNRRKLIVGHLLLSALALLFVGTAANLIALLAGLFVVGLLAVMIQTLVAFAATLAPSANRGQAVGTVTRSRSRHTLSPYRSWRAKRSRGLALNLSGFSRANSVCSWRLVSGVTSAPKCRSTSFLFPLATICNLLVPGRTAAAYSGSYLSTRFCCL